jgi:hypothetical protein
VTAGNRSIAPMTQPTYLGRGRQARFIVVPALFGACLGLGLWALLDRLLGKDLVLLGDHHSGLARENTPAVELAAGFAWPVGT